MSLDALIHHEQALVAALDVNDADGILAATQAMEHAIVALRKTSPAAVDRAALHDALALAEAARWRVAVLADQNETRITRMAEATGASAAPPVYGRHARLVRK